jgi:hypothetical protein
LTGEPREPAWHEGWAFRLLAILLAVYLLSAILASYPLASYAVDLGMVVACVVGLRRIAGGGTTFGVSTGLLSALLGLHWLAPILFGSESAWWRPIGSLAVLLLVLGTLLGSVFATERVTTDKIFAAACAYLLLGLCWSQAYQLAFVTDPAAFTLSGSDLSDPGAALNHFSFTTLTTVGFGAISPASKVARTLADLEALVGQLYVAVVLARLVSLQITHAGPGAARRAG